MLAYYLLGGKNAACILSQIENDQLLLGFSGIYGFFEGYLKRLELSFFNRNRTLFARRTCLLFLLMLMHCTQKQQAYQTAAVPVPETSGMLFLSFKMYADSLSGNRIALLNKIIVAQQLKMSYENSLAPNRIVISQLDDAKKVLSSAAQDHPLSRRVEIANDQGEIQSRIINLPEAEFFIRVTLRQQAAYIRVEEVIQNKIKSESIFNLRD